MVDASRPLTVAIKTIGADRWPGVLDRLGERADATAPSSSRTNTPVSVDKSFALAAASGFDEVALSSMKLYNTPGGRFNLASIFGSEPVLMLDDRGQPIIGGSGDLVMIPKLADPHFFVDRGLESREAVESPSPFLMGLLVVAADLFNFGHSFGWDLQRDHGENITELVDGATVVLGLYGAAAGIPEDALLGIQNTYAWCFSKFKKDVEMDKRWGSLPTRNVVNTHIGYELYRLGWIGPSHNRNKI